MRKNHAKLLVVKKERIIMASKNQKKTAVRKAEPVIDTKVEAEPDTGEDLFVVLGETKHQFHSQISKIYDVKEYFYKGIFRKGDSIRFIHRNGNDVPVHDTPNCGYTLVGKAQRLLSSKKALLANGEAGDDQEYVYINDHSELTFVADTAEYTLFVRVYDNLYGNNNDRWVVIYME